jgi:hypothetical protein
MQPLLNILETSHDGLIHGRVKMLPKVLQTSVQVTLPLLSHCLKALLHLLLHVLPKLSKGCVPSVLHALKIWVKVTSRGHPSMLLRLWYLWLIIHVLIMACSFSLFIISFISLNWRKGGEWPLIEIRLIVECLEVTMLDFTLPLKPCLLKNETHNIRSKV